MNVFYVYLHRYVRMTPLLAVCILVSMTLLRFMGNGPVWPIMLDFNTGHCERYWWSTLIYVQNYVNPKNIVSIDAILQLTHELVFFFLKQHSSFYLDR